MSRKLHLWFSAWLVCALLVCPSIALAEHSPAETGQASYYHDRFHGRPTASGEPYDRASLTAAHRTLPFGTWLRVTRIDTERSVYVRVTDRGPFKPGRVIDLSRQAAEEIDLIGPGVAEVELAVVEEPALTEYAVQVDPPPLPTPIPSLMPHLFP